jgi:hypothetical protein
VSKQVVLPCARTPVQVLACMVGARGKGSKEEILGVTVRSIRRLFDRLVGCLVGGLVGRLVEACGELCNVLSVEWTGLR